MKMLDRDQRPAGMGVDPAAARVALGRVGVKMERAVDGAQRGLVVLGAVGQDLGGEAQAGRVVARLGVDLARHAHGNPDIVGLVPALAHGDAADVGAQRLGEIEAGVDGECLVGEPTNIAEALAGHGIEAGQGPQVEVVGAHVARGLGPSLPDLLQTDARLDRAHDALGHPVLQVENVGDVAVEAVGPDVVAGGSVDQLANDPHPRSGLADAAFEHVAHAQLARDLAHVDRTALVGEAGITGDHEEGAHAAERGDDLLDQAIGEVLLLRIAAHVGEGQDRDRRPVGWRHRPQPANYAGSGAQRRTIPGQRVDGDRLGHVLDRMAGQIDDAMRQPAGDMLERGAERQMPPGSASASIRAAMFTPSPNRSPPWIMTSPTWMPIRNSRRRSTEISLLASASRCCTATAHSTAFTALANSASNASPAVLAIRPAWAAMASPRTARWAVSCRSVQVSSCSISRA